MSSLTPDDFSVDEQALINSRLAEEEADFALLDENIAGSTTTQATYDLLDGANQLVQDAVMLDVVTILLAIITARDIAEPAEAPHKIKFAPPPPGPSEVTWPVTTAAMTVAGGLPALASYDTPFVGATVVNGDIATNAGGWQLFHKNTMTLLEEIDPMQPTAGELTPAYTPLVAEFFDMQEARLNALTGRKDGGE